MDLFGRFHMLVFFIPALFFQSLVKAVDSIPPGQSLLDNATTGLVSRNGDFELGFFTPWNSGNRYVGIWFNKVPDQTIVWVANRNAPISDSTGSLFITSTGTITISANQSTVVWTANSPTTTVKNPILKLLDNGNLVLTTVTADDDDLDSFLWQSFDYPSDTLIPGMKLGWDLKKNQEWYLTSWRSVQDPALGDYTYRFNLVGLPSTILRHGSDIQFRSGPWDGVRFGGEPSPLQQNSVFNPIFVSNSTSLYYAFVNNDNSIITRFVLNQSGTMNHLSWNKQRNRWIEISKMKSDDCDDYAVCGNFSICDAARSPVCDCLTGFVPRIRQEWSQFVWAGGCVRRTSLNCTMPTGFRKFSSVKVPDMFNSVLNGTEVNREKCEAACLRSCSCSAYAMTQAIGCIHWFGDLIDIRVYAAGGLDLFVRMPKSELDSDKKPKTAIVIASVVGCLVLLIVVLVTWLIIRVKAGKNKTDMKADSQGQVENNSVAEEEHDPDLPLFDFLSILTATGDFACTNEIGKGGFGRVYKGILPNGKEIAIKRLSKDSGQGLREFKNEVILIAKLQHRNLVRLLGCCIHRDDRILVYEYMPNRSLDLFIFSHSRGNSLQWKTRFNIILGIARGLLYLHRDSRLRIIHRDLKASNVLLDSEMNPKISDFGLARMFRGEQYQDNTNLIVGTYGYMAPEYAVDGLFSVKSDVFSFGVLVLEIVNGKRNRGFFHPDHHLNLLGHAWRVWNAGNPIDVVDRSMGMAYEESEVVRSIQVGLLCVQKNPEDRPSMSDALLMLESEHLPLPQPNQPGYYTEREIIEAESSSTGKKVDTSNEITMTLLQGR